VSFVGWSAGGVRLAGERGRSDTGEFKRRFQWIGLGMVLLFLGLLVRLFQLQIIEHDDNRTSARDNIVRRVTLATTRGIIRDRTGKLLAASRPAYNVYVVPSRLEMQNVWPRLVEYLRLGPEERTRLEQKLLELRADDGKRKDQQLLLKEDISRDAVADIKTHERELVTLIPRKNGTNIEVTSLELVPVPVRYYPFEEVGAHVLGYMAEVDSDKLAQLHVSGYLEGDRAGVTGVERSWESYLRGTRGWEKVLVDAKGARRSGHDEIIEEPRRSEPIPGRDLRLTLDADVQKSLEKAFRGELAGGAAVVDVRTGRILGMYSKPTFDPNTLSGGSGKEVIKAAFRRLYSDPLKPLLDKTVSGAYPPGSTFKPFTALAALEKGLIDPHTMEQCRGAINFGKRIFRCTHTHGPVDLHKGIAESCNVYFYNLVKEHSLGLDVIAEMSLRYGLGAKTGIGINAEASGRMPTRAWMTLHNKGHYDLGFGLNAAIGQGATTVTMLQLALAYAALANGGTLYQPQLVRAVETSNGTVVQEFTPRVRRQIDITPANLKMVQKALEAGVTAEGGTALLAYNASGLREMGVDVAGKTGTAQVTHHHDHNLDDEKTWYFNRDHALFASYAPVRSPEVAVVAIVEHGGFGGKHAAPIVFEAVRAYQQFVRAPKSATTAARDGAPKPPKKPAPPGRGTRGSP
jgi:penicillin-binding protein 2